jgi:hypothetical protein
MGLLQPPEPRVAICQRCYDRMPTSELLEHLRLFHGDLEFTAERWEDGGLVKFDDLDMSLKDLLE